MKNFDQLSEYEQKSIERMQSAVISGKYVYFITDGEFTKIGFTKNIKQRLIELQTSNPKKLFLKKLINGDHKLESKIHLLFKKYRCLGEWFLLPNDWVDILDQNILLVKRKLKDEILKIEHDFKKEKLKDEIKKRLAKNKKQKAGKKLNTALIDSGIINEPMTITDEFALSVLNTLSDIGAVQTISDHAKQNGLSYNGVKKFREIREIFGVKFVIDNQ